MKNKQTTDMIRVLVIDDSAFNRRTITKMLEKHPNITVVDTAMDGQVAIRKVLKLDPDVITLDLEMPNMDGFTFLRWLMRNRPKPVIVISAYEGDENVVRALEMGAVDFIAKPGQITLKLIEIENELIDKVLQVARNVRFRKREIVTPQQRQFMKVQFHEIPITDRIKERYVIAIGASTGGPQAIRTILNKIYGIGFPILICQHMPPIFTRLFSDRLNAMVPIQVKEAEDGDIVRGGCAYVAPGGMHMTVELQKGYVRIRLERARTSERNVPSVDKLFSSVSRVYGPRALGVILTGMGDDGAIGARDIRKRGGKIIAESEATAVVYGMPKSVIDAREVDWIEGIDRIHEKVIEWSGILRTS